MRFFLKIVRGLARRGWRLRAGCPKKRIEEVMVIALKLEDEREHL